MRTPKKIVDAKTLFEHHTFRKPKGKGRWKTDRRIYPYMLFHLVLENQQPAIDQLLQLFQKELEQKLEAEASLHVMRRKMSADLAAVWDEVQLENAALAHQESRKIFAGTVFVTLNNLLLSMRARIVVPGKPISKAGRVIRGVSLLEIIRSASNNFRHYEQWNNSRDAQCRRDINALRRLGFRSPWRKNICDEILDLIDWKDGQQACREVRRLGSEIFQMETGIRL